MDEGMAIPEVAEGLHCDFVFLNMALLLRGYVE